MRTRSAIEECGDGSYRASVWATDGDIYETCDYFENLDDAAEFLERTEKRLQSFKTPRDAPVKLEPGEHAIAGDFKIRNLSEANALEFDEDSQAFFATRDIEPGEAIRLDAAELARARGGKLERGQVYAESEPVELDTPTTIELTVPIPKVEPGPKTWDVIMNPHGARRLNLLCAGNVFARIEPGSYMIFEPGAECSLQSENGEPIKAIWRRGLSYGEALAVAQLWAITVPANLLENGESNNGNASPTKTAKPADWRP